MRNLAKNVASHWQTCAGMNLIRTIGAMMQGNKVLSAQLLDGSTQRCWGVEEYVLVSSRYRYPTTRALVFTQHVFP
jgi:hypothetical protein